MNAIDDDYLNGAVRHLLGEEPKKISKEVVGLEKNQKQYAQKAMSLSIYEKHFSKYINRDQLAAKIVSMLNAKKLVGKELFEVDDNDIQLRAAIFIATVAGWDSKGVEAERAKLESDIDSAIDVPNVKIILDDAK